MQHISVPFRGQEYAFNCYATALEEDIIFCCATPDHTPVPILQSGYFFVKFNRINPGLLATSGYATQRVYDVDLREPLAWLFGHEGQGVADDLLALATRTVVIPHLGEIESLNVAACAAVCFFEQVRQKTA